MAPSCGPWRWALSFVTDFPGPSGFTLSVRMESTLSNSLISPQRKKPGGGGLDMLVVGTVQGLVPMAVVVLPLTFSQ